MADQKTEARRWWWNQPRYSRKDIAYLFAGMGVTAVIIRLPTIVGWFS